jgi:hypothetical protein
VTLKFTRFYASVKCKWSRALRLRHFRIELFSVLIVLYSLGIFSQLFFVQIEKRQGQVLKDVILAFIPAYNMSWVIFPLIYIALSTALLYLLLYPQRLVVILQAYGLLTVLRLTFIYFISLDPPYEMILLKDPLVDYFIYDEHLVTKDLFFSGHTSSVFIFYLAVKNRELKLFLLLMSISVGMLVLVQHVHYTVDVVAAPFFSWISLIIVKKIRKLLIL